jgi:DNA repair protein RecO (recombination protein O)
MPLEKSEAIVLKAFNWSESSRTVVLFSHEYGKLALVDKGGRRLTSKRGRLISFSRLEITFYSSQRETRGYLSDTELLESYSFEDEAGLGRLAYGSAACELLYLLLPEEEPQRTLYHYFVEYLRRLSRVERRSLPALFCAFFLRLMSQLGYRPSLAFCATCGREITDIGVREDTDERHLSFSPERGGFVCEACQKPGERYIPVSAEGARLLVVLQRASLDEAASLPIGYRQAARLLEVLTAFLKYHAGLVSDLKSLQFLEKLKNSQLNG